MEAICIVRRNDEHSRSRLTVSPSRSPGHHVPWWVLIWLKRSPLVFLVLSVACFSIGLVLFTYSSHQVRLASIVWIWPCLYRPQIQHFTVSVITTVFTAFSSFGLVAVSMWFIFERWVFIRHRGSKWLRDSLDDCWATIVGLVSRRRFLSAVHRTMDAIKTAKSSLIELFRHHPTAEIIIAPSPSWSSLTHAPSSAARTIPNNFAESERTRSPSPMPSANTETQTSSQHPPGEMNDDAAPAVPRPARRARFVQAIRSVIIAQQGPSGMPRAPPNILSPEGVRQEELRGLIRCSRVARLAPKLRDFAPTQEFAAHQALVRHLQFSPNGKLLATSRLASCSISLGLSLMIIFRCWDNTSAIFSTSVSTARSWVQWHLY